MTTIRLLKIAAKESEKSTPLRQSVFLRYNYIHKIEEAKEEGEEGFNSIHKFNEHILSEIDSVAGRLVKYNNLKNKCKLLPLAPLKEESPSAMSRVESVHSVHTAGG
jgi:hypothetical protein